jgi:hypothetical protein
MSPILFAMTNFVIGLFCLVVAVTSELLEAQLLKVGRELRSESILAPGTKTYILSSDGMFPYEAVEIRISHLSLPPAKFTFEVTSFPDDGSVLVKKRTRKPNLRRRRRLNTAITTLTTGKTGSIVLDDGTEGQRTLLIVSAVPTGVRPGEGREKQVEVKYNIIMERKVMNNAIPETALRMIGFGVICLCVSAMVLVPMLSNLLRRGDEVVLKNKNVEDKRIS